jgi:hypothetical protein
MSSDEQRKAWIQAEKDCKAVERVLMFLPSFTDRRVVVTVDPDDLPAVKKALRLGMAEIAKQG